jgi:hypothetical protein
MNHFESLRSTRAWLAAAFAALLGACATPVPYPFTLVDARTETRFGDARTTVEGAEILLADNAIGPSLNDRLARRLSEQAGGPLVGRTIRIDRADATIYIHDATASARMWFINGQQIPVIKSHQATPQRRVRVELAGTVDGKPFAGAGERSYRVTSGQSELAQAVDDAVTAAVASARTQL